MSLTDVAAKRKESGDKALVAFLTAGYPDEETFLSLVRAASQAGCEIIEIGIPFSDPIADGPLIQASSKQALDNGITLERCFELTGKLSSEIPTPLVFMSYYNPILRMGFDRFTECATASRLSGLIVPDVPIEESGDIRQVLEATDVTYIDLIAPTSSDDRIARITDAASGFLYLVSVTGVTGVRSPEANALASFVGRVRRRTATPLYVGFGIADADRAREAVRFCDGVIIGSALIKLIQTASSTQDAVASVGDFLAGVKSSIRLGRPDEAQSAG